MNLARSGCWFAASVASQQILRTTHDLSDGEDFVWLVLAAVWMFGHAAIVIGIAALFGRAKLGAVIGIPFGAIMGYRELGDGFAYWWLSQ